MSLSAASSAMGIPEPLVQRSAAARATETGTTVDEILAAWAGGGPLPVVAPEVSDESDAPTPASPAVPADGPPTSEGTQDVAPTSPAVPADSPPRIGGATPSTAPMPSEVTSREAARLPEVITVPTAGIRERTNSTIPRWLTTLLLAAPLFALFALGGLATGECGEATELLTDVVSGDIVNCDGSEFTGSGGPDGGPDFLAVGEGIYQGSPGNCFGCHGAQGQGSAAFPGMGGVMTTFSSCSDHIEWVTLGALGFRQSGRDTYGDTQRPVNAMPGFGGSLTDEQIASVVAFERVQFGGGDPDQVAVDCGLVETEEPNGEPGEDSNGGDEEAWVDRPGRGATS